MSTVTREQLPGLCRAADAVEGRSSIRKNGMIDGHILLRDLREWIAQASAAPEQKPVALQHMAVAEDGELRWMTGRKVDNCELYAMPDFGRAPSLYTHADPSEVAVDPPGSFAKHMEYMERCRQQQKTIDGMNAAHWEVVQKLEAATQRADAAEDFGNRMESERDLARIRLAEAVGLLQRVHDAETADGQCYPSERRILMCNIEDYLLSASAEPAEVKP